MTGMDSNRLPSTLLILDLVLGLCVHLNSLPQLTHDLGLAAKHRRKHLVELLLRVPRVDDDSDALLALRHDGVRHGRERVAELLEELSQRQARAREDRKDRAEDGGGVVGGDGAGAEGEEVWGDGAEGFLERVLEVLAEPAQAFDELCAADQHVGA